MSPGESELVNREVGGIFRDALKYLPAKFTPFLCNLLTLGLFTRLLSPGEYGELTLFTIGAGLGISFGYGWLSTAAFRHYEPSVRRGDAEAFFGALLLGYAAMCLGVAFVGVIAVSMGKAGGVLATPLRIGLVVLWVWMDALLDLLLNIARATRAIRNYTWGAGVQIVLKTILALVAAGLAKWGVTGIVGAYAVASAVTVSVLLVQGRWRYPVSIRRRSLELLRTLVSYGLPVSTGSLGVTVLAVGDRYVLQWLKGPDMVGVYSAGYQIAANMVLIPSSLLMLGAYTVLIQVYERQGHSEVEALLKRLASVLLLFGVPVVIGTVVFREPLVDVLLGSKFGRAKLILGLIAAGQLCLAIAEYYEKSFQLGQRTLRSMALVFLAAGVNVLLNFLLVPFLNEVGAAVATFASYLLYAFLLARAGRSLLAWAFPWRTLGAAVAAAALCGLGVVIVVASAHTTLAGWAGLVVAFGVGYVALLWVWNEEVVVEAVHAIARTAQSV